MNGARTQDDDHLRLLSIFHYVVGGLAGLFSLFPILHVFLGLMFVFSPGSFQGNGEPPPPVIGWIFVIAGSLIIVVGLAFATCVLLAGRFLATRRHYLFCLVMGGVQCLFMPLGTILGVFTIIVLMRETVKPLFRTSGRNQPGRSQVEG